MRRGGHHQTINCVGCDKYELYGFLCHLCKHQQCPVELNVCYSRIAPVAQLGCNCAEFKITCVQNNGIVTDYSKYFFSILIYLLKRILKHLFCTLHIYMFSLHQNTNSVICCCSCLENWWSTGLNTFLYLLLYLLI